MPGPSIRTSPDTIDSVAVIGSKRVAREWICRLALSGTEVHFYDPAHESGALLAHELSQARIQWRNLAFPVSPARFRRGKSISEAVNPCSVVIVVVSCDDPADHKLVAEVAQLVEPQTTLAINFHGVSPRPPLSEFLPPDERTVAVGIVQPVYIAPTIEVSCSDKTDEKHRDRFLRCLVDAGMTPIVTHSYDTPLVETAFHDLVTNFAEKIMEGKADFPAVVTVATEMMLIGMLNSSYVDLGRSAPVFGETAIKVKHQHGDLTDEFLNEHRKNIEVDRTIVAVLSSLAARKQGVGNSLEPARRNIARRRVSTAEQAQDSNVSIAALPAGFIERTSQSAMKAVCQEWPRMLDFLAHGEGDLVPARIKNPSFYGAGTMHSSVHLHWAIHTLLRRCPERVDGEMANSIFDSHFSQASLGQELATFLEREGLQHNFLLGWICRLSAEVLSSDHEDSQRWAGPLNKLARQVERNLLKGISVSEQPFRSPATNNHAYSLNNVMDLAEFRATQGNSSLLDAVRSTSIRWFGRDRDFPIEWDVRDSYFSAFFAEVMLMQRVLPDDEFCEWLYRFAPRFVDSPLTVGFTPLRSYDSDYVWSSYQLGQNMYRSEAFRRVAKASCFDDASGDLLALADRHFDAAAIMLMGDHPECENWLPSFAVSAMIPVWDRLFR